MENSFQTSFIPKKPINASPISKRKEPASLFSVFSIFVLVASAVFAGGLFVYKGYLTQQRESLAQSLVKGRDSFDADTIEELELFDKRTSTAKQVLNGHIVLSPLFSLIGSLTIPSIQYTKFDHKTTDKGFSVSMVGTARDYKSIALQADVFNTAKGRFFKNVIFSNLTKDKDNFVQFNLEFDVDPSLLSYEKDILLNSQNATGGSSVNNSDSLLSPSDFSGESTESIQ